MIRRHAGSPTKLLAGTERRPGRRRRHGLALTDYLSSASPEGAVKAALLSSCDCRVENENKKF